MKQVVETFNDAFSLALFGLGIVVCICVVNSLFLSIISSLRQHFREQELATHELEIKKIMLEKTMNKCLEEFENKCLEELKNGDTTKK